MASRHNVTNTDVRGKADACGRDSRRLNELQAVKSKRARACGAQPTQWRTRHALHRKVADRVHWL